MDNSAAAALCYMVLNGAAIDLKNVECRTPLYYIRNAELKKTLKKIALGKMYVNILNILVAFFAFLHSRLVATRAILLCFDLLCSRQHTIFFINYPLQVLTSSEITLVKPIEMNLALETVFDTGLSHGYIFPTKNTMWHGGLFVWYIQN